MKLVLSIDGGGIRGIVPAMVLAEIEKRTGKPISESFDMIGGTSTGGILALGLAKPDKEGKAEFSAEELAELYRDRGEEIFSRSFMKKLTSLDGIAEEMYSAEGIENVLEEYFGDEYIGNSLTKTFVTSYDILNRAPYFMKSWKEDRKSIEMKHAARATSAAPTYFEPALIPAEGSMKALIDGGVFINNPSMSAYAEAKKVFGQEEEVVIFSLGTGELIKPIDYSKAKNWGKAKWLSPLLDSMFDGQSDAVNYQLKQILGDNYIRLQNTLTKASEKMDNASEKNIDHLFEEAQKIIETHSDEIDKIVTLIKQKDNKVEHVEENVNDVPLEDDTEETEVKTKEKAKENKRKRKRTSAQNR